LQREEIEQLAIESIRPNVGVGPGIDELNVYAHPIAGAADRSLQDMGHAQRIADLAQVPQAGLVLAHRGPADHFQVRDLGQVREDVVLDAVGEIFVFLAVTQVLEWQDGDAFIRRRHGYRQRGFGDIEAPRLRLVHFIGALDSFRCELKCPGQKQRDRKTKRQQNDHQTHCPGRDFEKRKSLRGNLDEQPAQDRISNRDAVDFAPL
jgi:hypothetical protein